MATNNSHLTALGGLALGTSFAGAGTALAGSKKAAETAVGLGKLLGKGVIAVGKAVPYVLAATAIYGAAKEGAAVINRNNKYGYDESARIYHDTDYQRVLSDYKMNIYRTYGAEEYNKFNFKVSDIIDKAVEQHYVSKEDAKLAKEYYKYYETHADKEGWNFNEWLRATGKLQSYNSKMGTNAEVDAIKRVAEGCAKVAFPKAVNIDDFLENMYNTNSIPSPEYIAQINPDTDKLPVPEAKWYTGQEMADLFDINYDPNYYYDLIKRGTGAAVEAQQYQNDQAIAASMMDDAVSRNQYLQSLDSSKADAVIKGATLGQRMANELLANANAANTYSANQANVLNQAMTNIEPFIQKDAQAGITAANYYNKNVFQPIGTNIEDLYYNDINRIGAIENYNANVYAANQAYNAAAAQANAGMKSAYDYAVGQLNAAKNDYRMLYETYYNTNANPYKYTSDAQRSIWAFDQTNANFSRNNPYASVE